MLFDFNGKVVKVGIIFPNLDISTKQFFFY